MFYEQYFRIVSSEAATMVSAESKADGLKVDGYYIVVDATQSIGVVDAPLSPEAQKKLKPVDGTTVPANTVGFVVTEVEYTGSGEKATDSGLVLEYKIGDTKYAAKFPNKFEIGRC
jgi:hypothetical protein